MALSANEIAILIRAKDEASRVMQQVGGEGGRLGKTLGTVLKTGAVAAGLAIAGVGTAAYGAWKLIQGNVRFEQFSTQFEVLLGSATAAQQRMEELERFGRTTPFELPGVVQASRVLQVFTGDALATGEGLRMVGDIAAGTGRPFEEVAMWTGRMYDALQSGRPIGEAAMRLQEMGAMSGQTRGKIEQLTKAGTDFSEIWGVVTTEVGGKFAGMMDKQSATLGGMVSNLQDWFDSTKRILAEPLFEIVKDKLADLLEWLDSPGVQSAITNFASNLAEWMGKGSEAAGDLFGELLKFGKDIWPDLVRFGGAAVELFQAFYDAAKPLAPLIGQLARIQFRLLIGALAEIADLLASHPELVYAIIAAWAAWKITGLITQVRGLMVAVKGLNIALAGPAGAVVMIGAGAVALRAFVDSNRDAIDKIPVFGGLVKASARYQRELNEALEQANDLYERNLITVEELSEKGLQAYADALVTLQDEHQEAIRSQTLFAEVTIANTELVGAAAAKLVEDMQREGATYEQTMDALTRAGIDWKTTTIQDVLLPARQKASQELEAIDQEMRDLELAHKRLATEAMKYTGMLAEETGRDYEEIKQDIADLLPTIDQTMEEWQAQLVQMFDAQVNFERNLRTLYTELRTAQVQNVDEIIRTVEEGGPLAAKAAIAMLEEGTAGLETYRLLGEHINVARSYAGDITGAIITEYEEARLAGAGLGDAIASGFDIPWEPFEQEIIDLKHRIQQELRGSPHYWTYYVGQDMAREMREGFGLAVGDLAKPNSLTGAAAPAGGGTVIHYHNHFEGPLLGDTRQMEEIARQFEPHLRKRLR